MTVSKPETVEVSQADRDLVFSLMSPAARNEIEKLALEYIRDGRGDDAEAVQAVARHRLNATPSRQDGLREALAKTIANDAIEAMRVHGDIDLLPRILSRRIADRIGAALTP